MYEVPEAICTYEERTLEARYVLVGDLYYGQYRVDATKMGRTRITLSKKDSQGLWEDIDNPLFVTPVNVLRPIETDESRKVRLHAIYNNEIVYGIEDSKKQYAKAIEALSTAKDSVTMHGWGYVIQRVSATKATLYWMGLVEKAAEEYFEDHIAAVRRIKRHAMDEVLSNSSRTNRSTSPAQNFVDGYYIEAAADLVRLAKTYGIED